MNTLQDMDKYHSKTIYFTLLYTYIEHVKYENRFEG